MCFFVWFRSIKTRQAPISFPTSMPISSGSVKPSILHTEDDSIDSLIFEPTSQPVLKPSIQPVVRNSTEPTGQSLSGPSPIPRLFPTAQPTANPNLEPSEYPSVITNIPKISGDRRSLFYMSGISSGKFRLTKGFLLSEWKVAGCSFVDDTPMSKVSLPFHFLFGGKRFNEVYLNANGGIFFSPAPPCDNRFTLGPCNLNR
jgi:hypothetical protein